MKTTVRILFAAFVLVAVSLQTHAQGVIDQQSYPGPISIYTPYVDGLYLTDQGQGEYFEQTFIPSLSAIDFVALEFEPGNVPATVFVNLYEGSPSISSQTLLGTTTAVTMPSGFNNNGLTGAGIEDFYFSTPITLTPGDEYYFQPFLEMGGEQWSYVTMDNDYTTYPNGELYVDGGAFATKTEMWFQEGIAVPEPTTLALIGFSCLLIFMFKWRAKLPVMLFASALFTLPVLSVYASPDSVVQATASEAGLTQIPTSDLSGLTGTFWIATIDTNNGLIMLPPYPMLPTNMMDLPTFLITNDIYLSDGTKGRLSSSPTEFMSTSEASSAALKQSQTVENLIEMMDSPPLPPGGGGGDNTNFPPHYNGLPATADTTNIWLLATNDADGSSLDITLKNSTGENYQLLSTTNSLLDNTPWDLGQILQGANVNYNNVFSPVPYNNAMTFFRVHQANPIMYVYYTQNAIEPNPTNNDPGQVGNFYIVNESYSTTTNNLKVYFTLSGTAQNGIDYSNIPGSVVISNSIGYALINIDPIADGLKPNQTVILTLTQDTNYLIQPVNDSTNTITANPQVYPLVNGDNISACPNSESPFTLQAQDLIGRTLVYHIITWPAHGILNTNGAPNCTYTPTNCFEGQDSFTFYVSDGVYSSGSATITLNVSDTVFALPVSAQTCPGTPVTFTLFGEDVCGGLLNYALLSNPADGSASITGTNITYTPYGTNWTGEDSFNYVAYNDCGNAATGTITVAVGDNSVYTAGLNCMTGTNQPLAITLPTIDYDNCINTNDYLYTITSNPANGTLSGSGANVIYTPNYNYEGVDSFQFKASDGVWPPHSASTVNICVVGAPILSIGCDPFGSAIRLSWILDTNVENMRQDHQLIIQGFVLYRSTSSAVRGEPIYTNNTSSINETTWNYLDGSAVIGQAYYYTVNFESAGSGITYESPFSNQVGGSSQVSEDLIPANAYWNVVTNLFYPSVIVTNLQAPFSSFATNGAYPGLYPPPNTYWKTNSTWSNSITMFIPTNTPMTNVQYSIAIDNSYLLYVNNNFVGAGSNNNVYAVWSPFQSFPTNLLHYGTNNVNVQIQDVGDINYFSMVVTTNTCGY